MRQFAAFPPNPPGDIPGCSGQGLRIRELRGVRRRGKWNEETARTRKRSLLILEDDRPTREALIVVLHTLYETSSASTCRQAVASAITRPPDLAILDLSLPDGTGFDVQMELLRLNPSIRSVVFSAWDNLPNAIEAGRLGITAFVAKRFGALKQIQDSIGRVQVDPPPLNVAQAALATPAMSALLAALTGARSPRPVLDMTTETLAAAHDAQMGRAIARAEGNKTVAARMLGVSRGSLWHKLRKCDEP